MSEFTKGKWQLDKENGYVVRAVKLDKPVVIVIGERNAEQQANARLIENAPDLYRMLQINANILETLIQEYDLFEDADVAWLNKHLDEAEKVLARIDGEEAQA